MGNASPKRLFTEYRELESWPVKPVIRSDCRRNHRSDGGIVSAHADVSSNPRATNAAKHCWIQKATKWFDRNEVGSRNPRHAADVRPNTKRTRLCCSPRRCRLNRGRSCCGFHEAPIPGNWYKTQKCPSRVPGVISESRRSRSDSRCKNESSGSIGSRSQPNTRPMR